MDMTSYLSMSNQASLDALLLVTYLVILNIYPSISEQYQTFRQRHLARDNEFSKYLKEYYLLQHCKIMKKRY